MIYINGKEVKPYVGDYKPLTVYKGTEKLAGWVENTTEISSNIRIENGYSTMKVKPFGKSEQVQTEQGKNLFMKQGLSTPVDTENFWSNFTYTTPLEDGWCKVEVNNTGTTSAMYANQMIKRGNIDKIKPDTNYIIWAEFRNIETNNAGNYANLCGSENISIWTGNVAVPLNAQNKKIIQKVKTKTDISNATLDLRNFVSVTNNSYVTLEYRMMILEDVYTDEEIQNYEPFIPDSPSPNYPSEIENVSGDLEVKVVGKNLFNYNSEVTNFGSTYATREKITNGYKMTATSTSSAQRCQLIIPMEILTVGKKYTLSYKSDFNPTKIRVGDASGIDDTTGYDKYGSFNNVTTGKITFTLTEKSKKYLIFALYNANAQTGDTYSIWNIQVEYSETATELEEYKEQVVTFPLGEQKLMKDGYLGDNGIHNKRTQITLTGQEGWVISNIQPASGTRFDTIIRNVKPTVNNIALSNFFKHNGVNKDGIWVNTGDTLGVRIQTPNFNTVEELKAWLAEKYESSTPVIVEYEIEEETIEYTSEQQTAYNNLQKLKTYRTVTNISNSQNTNMKIIYKINN